MRLTRRWLAWVALVLGLAVAVLGLGWAPTARGLPNIGTVPLAQALPSVPATAAAPAARTPPAVPVRLRLPSLAVDAPVTPVTVQPGGGLAVPNDPHVVGWWRAGAAPGSPAGTVVLDGHVDTRVDGPGALFRLADLRPGDVVSLATRRGPLSYVVRAVRSYLKALLPAEVFDTSGAPRLVLISCGGEFNGHTRQYADNIVAYAVPVGSGSAAG